MLTNALLAGALGAAYLTVLVLQINPDLPLASITPLRWFATIGLLHGLHFAVTVYVVMVLREFFALDMLSPGWASVRVLAWIASVLAALAAVLMWTNLSGFAAALDDAATRHMRVGAIATTVSAAVLLAVAIAHYSFGRRGSRVGAALFTLAVTASIALPVAARGMGSPASRPLVTWTAGSLPEGAPEPGPRVVMILLDGASSDYVWPRAAEGRLPNFARMLDHGASMALATTRPAQPDPVWVAVATGMYPSKNGVRSASSYFTRFGTRSIDLLPDHCFSHALVHWGFVREEPKTSADWRARPIWSILNGANLRAAVVRWPLTFPAQPVRDFIVTDKFHQAMETIAEFDAAAYPPEVLPIVQEAFSDPIDRAALERVAAGGGSTSPEEAVFRRDSLYARTMRRLRAGFDARFVALRYEGLDTIGHYYFRYAQPRTFRDRPEEERRRLAQVIDRYYAFIDGEIGAAIESLNQGDLLVVVSGFGMQPANAVKQAMGRLLGDPDFSGTHEHGPDGFLLAYGSNVKPGHYVRGSVVDVTPTLLYFLGLPIGRDMDGYARADLFTPEFTAERPIAFIATYDR
jgi:predicted AlkP superfamily phosphohydrolase/phosphomutase